MVGLIERRSYEFGHSGIHHRKAFLLASLHIKHTGKNEATLRHERSSWLKMHLLSYCPFQIMMKYLKIAFKIGNWFFVRGRIVYAQTSAHIQKIKFSKIAFKI